MADQPITLIEHLQQSFEAANGAFEAAENRAYAVRDARGAEEMREHSLARNAEKAALARTCSLSQAICLEPPMNLRDTLITLSHLYLIAEDFEANLSCHREYDEPTKRLSRGLEFAIGRLSLEIDETLTGSIKSTVVRNRDYLAASLAKPEMKEAA